MLDRRTRPDSASASTDGTERLTPGRVTVTVAACTGLLAVFIWLGPALDTYVLGALVAASLTALLVAVTASIVGPRVGSHPVAPLVGIANQTTDRLSGRRVRTLRAVHWPAASLSVAVAAIVLYGWSVELDALRSGYAAGTLAGGLAYAVLASRLPRW